MIRTGTDIAKSLVGRKPADREAAVLAAVRNGEVPRRLSDRARWCAIAAGGGRLILTVSCRPVELGTDVDSFLAPMRPETAQAVADHFGAILPSRTIVDALWAQTVAARLPIAPPRGFKIPGPDMLDVRSWIAHNAEIQRALAGVDGLVVGGKKDVAVGPNLDGSRVAIYSTPFSGRGGPRPAGGHQPYSTIHTPDHVDYSHGVRLVQRVALLDGLPVDLRDVFADPKRAGLVSDQGPFAPRFPNGTRTSFSADRGGTARHVDPPPRTGGASAVASEAPAAATSGAILGGVAGALGAAALSLAAPWVVIFSAGGALIGSYLARGGR